MVVRQASTLLKLKMTFNSLVTPVIAERTETLGVTCNFQTLASGTKGKLPATCFVFFYQNETGIAEAIAHVFCCCSQPSVIPTCR